MYDPIVFILFAAIVLAAVYFYIQRRKRQGAFGGRDSAPSAETSEEAHE